MFPSDYYEDLQDSANGMSVVKSSDGTFTIMDNGHPFSIGIESEDEAYELLFEYQSERRMGC
jgi:hypothetical protein